MFKVLRKFRWTIVALATALLVAGAAHAQEPARPAVAVVGDDYDALAQQMDRAPASVDASFRFAEQAIERGDYETAIGALKRLLVFKPDLPRVKLEIGVLYFKLGSYEVAKGYFEDAIKSAGVPQEVKNRVQIYLAEINRRLSPYEYALFLQSGERYQTNATVGPDSSVVHAFGQPAQLGSQFAHAPDWNWFELAALSFSYKLDHRGDAIELTLLEYYSRQSKFTQFDLGLIEATVGPRVYLNQTVSIKPYVIGDAVWLGEAPYFDAAGGGGSIRSPIGDHLLVEAYAEQRYRQFYDSSNFPTSSQQTGDLTTVAVSTDLTYGFWHLTARLSLDHDVATFDYNSYDRWSVDLGAPMQFSVPIFDMTHQLVFTPTVGFSYTPYRAPDLMVDPITNRLDREYRLGAIVDFQIWRNYGIRAQLTQTWVRSTLSNFTTNDFTVAIGPTARF